jgi:hypothetical protein
MWGFWRRVKKVTPKLFSLKDDTIRVEYSEAMETWRAYVLNHNCFVLMSEHETFDEAIAAAKQLKVVP